MRRSPNPAGRNVPTAAPAIGVTAVAACSSRPSLRRARVRGRRLDRLDPEHLERLYQRMIEGGARPGTAHQVHPTVRTALGEAVRRNYAHRNVAELAKPPRIEVEPIEPYSPSEVQAILSASRCGRNGARWGLRNTGSKPNSLVLPSPGRSTAGAASRPGHGARHRRLPRVPDRAAPAERPSMALTPHRAGRCRPAHLCPPGAAGHVPRAARRPPA